MARSLAVAALVLSIGTIVAYGILVQRWLIIVPPIGYLTALALAVVLAAVAVARSRRWLTLGALTVAVLGLGLASVFNFVLMRVPAMPSAFVVGAPAPDFTLPDATGRPVRLAEFRGRQPVVLVFYRGHW